MSSTIDDFCCYTFLDNKNGHDKYVMPGLIYVELLYASK